MKVTLILFISFIYLEGCSPSKSTISKQNMQLVNAIFKQWSDPPLAGSEVPERGIDLTITVQHWPEGYTPNYIVYDKRKSLSAIIADTIKNKFVITGRIIRTSGMIKERSERVELSDRLVFSNPEGKTGYIEIKDWQRSKGKDK